MKTTLQWGGRFTEDPDPALLAFGSSLEDDLVLAQFDARVSRAHVAALKAGSVIGTQHADALANALDGIAQEIETGAFVRFARSQAFEDVHGAIDARIRELEPGAGAYVHAGRSRNDQVATSLALYAADRARRGAASCISIARHLAQRARVELDRRTLLASTTHGQPAQPVLLAFWLLAAGEPFLRAATRFERCATDAMRSCPLGSGAVAGTTLPLDRNVAAAMLGFAAPSRNAMDAVGTRDAILDVAHGFVRAAADASRISGELIVWAAPAFGYVRLGERSSTGSSLMPQKRNPDIFELTRGTASELLGLYSGALSSITGLPLSYYRDLQQTKRMALQICERGLAALDAFARALADASFDRDRMRARAGDGYTVATDMADALVRDGVSPREAHERVGALVAEAEAASAPIADAPDPLQSIEAKATIGSTSPAAVAHALDSFVSDLDALEAAR